MSSFSEFRGGLDELMEKSEGLASLGVLKGLADYDPKQGCNDSLLMRWKREANSFI